MTKQQNRKQPEHKWNFGNIIGKMWRNSGRMNEDGSREPDYFSSEVYKVYKDKDNNWKKTHTLSGDENLKAEKLRGMIYQHEQYLRAKDRETEHERSGPQREEKWHDDEKSRSEIKRERFQEKRQSQGTRQSIFRERKAR